MPVHPRLELTWIGKEHRPCLILLILLVVLSSGCDTVMVPKDTSVVMPLAVGNRWIGRHPWWSSEKHKYDTLEIIGERVVAGEKWYAINEYQVLANRADGFVVGFIADTGVSISHQIRFPCSAGDTIIDLGVVHHLQDDSSHGGLFHHGVVVTDADVVITVPAGTFRCIELEYCVVPIEGDPWMPISEPGRAYLAPGIGLVKTEGPFPNIIGSFGGGGDWELVDIHLK